MRILLTLISKVRIYTARQLHAHQQTVFIVIAIKFVGRMHFSMLIAIQLVFSLCLGSESVLITLWAPNIPYGVGWPFRESLFFSSVGHIVCSLTMREILRLVQQCSSHFFVGVGAFSQNSLFVSFSFTCFRL